MPRPETSSQDTLYPCLFDRLVDDDIQNPKDTRDAQMMSWPRYRAAVLRDVSWLLNSNNHLGNHVPEETEGLEDFPEAEASVLNFGKSSLAGLGVSGINLANLEAELERAVRNFEPRIRRIKVRALEESERRAGNDVNFEIRGELWAQHAPEKFVLTLDLETGTVKIR